MRKIPTYERFHRHVTAWVDREIDPLFVLGAPGVGKSHAYKTAIGNRPHHHFSARQTPLQVYITLYDAPHLPIVFDDISALLRDANFIDMLKALLESGQRLVRWGTTTSKLDGRHQSFECTAPVMIVLNRLPSWDPDVMAVLDRCDAIRFKPTKAEVISRMREIFPEDGELIDLLAELPAMPTLRTLIKARKWQASSHLNLVEELLGECGVPRHVAHLAQIMETAPQGEWRQRYINETGLTERTFRRHRDLACQLVECRGATHISESVSECPPLPG